MKNSVKQKLIKKLKGADLATTKKIHRLLWGKEDYEEHYTVAGRKRHIAAIRREQGVAAANRIYKHMNKYYGKLY